MSSKPTTSELKQTILQIKNIIKELDNKQIYGQENRENYFFTFHTDIMNLYPFLVSQIISGNDLTMLDLMLSQLEQVEKGKCSNDQVDITIGEKLADAYLKK
jgi:hypothetical protein